MKGLLSFLWLWLRTVLFISVLTAIAIGVLFAVGTEAEGYSTPERFALAIRYGLYVGGVFGTLLALYISLRSWRVERINKKRLARRQQADKRKTHRDRA